MTATAFDVMFYPVPEAQRLKVLRDNLESSFRALKQVRSVSVKKEIEDKEEEGILSGGFLELREELLG